MSTLVSTLSYPVMLGIIQKAVGDFVLTDDMLISALFGGLFIGLAYWNDWQNGLYYITKPELYSVQQILNNMLRNIEYLTKNSSAAQKSTTLAGSLPASTVRMAIAVVGMLPILVIYPFIQKYFVKGIALGAVKE